MFGGETVVEPDGLGGGIGHAVHIPRGMSHLNIVRSLLWLRSAAATMMIRGIINNMTGKGERAKPNSYIFCFCETFILIPSTTT